MATANSRNTNPDGGIEDSVRYGDEWSQSNISYSFASNVPSGVVSAFTDYIERLDDLIDLDFNKTSNGVIHVEMDPNMTGMLGVGFTPGPAEEDGNIYFNEPWFDLVGNTPEVGDRDYQLINHEIHHALGLKHSSAANGFPAIPGQYDSGLFSIQSERGPAGSSSTPAGSWNTGPGALDLEALVEMYGDENYAGGNTVHTITSSGAYKVDGATVADPDGSRFTGTIFDFGGNDTLNLSGLKGNIVGGLGELDQIHLGRNNGDIGGEGSLVLQMWGDDNTFDMSRVIENARLGSAADVFEGNDFNNSIWGLDGADVLRGLDGADALYGGAGDDKLYGGPGKDKLWGGSGRDGFESKSEAMDWQQGVDYVL